MALTLQQRWSSDAGAAVFSSPVVTGAGTGSPRIIAATVAGTVIALCALSGQQIWKTEVAGQVFADLCRDPAPPRVRSHAQPGPLSALHHMMDSQVDADTTAEAPAGAHSEGPGEFVLVSTNTPDAVAMLCAESGRALAHTPRPEAGAASSAPAPFRTHGVVRTMQQGHVLVSPHVKQGTDMPCLDAASGSARMQWLQVSNAGDLLLLAVDPFSHVCESSRERTGSGCALKIACIDRSGVPSFSGGVQCLCGRVVMIGRRDDSVHALDLGPAGKHAASATHQRSGAGFCALSQ